MEFQKQYCQVKMTGVVAKGLIPTLTFSENSTMSNISTVNGTCMINDIAGPRLICPISRDLTRSPKPSRRNNSFKVSRMAIT